MSVRRPGDVVLTIADDAVLGIRWALVGCLSLAGIAGIALVLCCGGLTVFGLLAPR